MLGLSNRQAARIAGCTHKAIGDAKAVGHLLTLSDGSVSPEALEQWREGRRAPRGYRRHVSAQRKPQISPPGKFAHLPDAVLSLSCIAEGLPWDVALELLPHLPEALVRAIHAKLLGKWRNTACELIEDYEPPAGITSWRQHELFNQRVDVDWDELKAEAGLILPPSAE